jgi:hypothetical protein
MNVHKLIPRADEPQEESAPYHFNKYSPWRDYALEGLVSREWIYGRHYLAGALSATVGAPGSGKTSLAIAEAVAIATGRNLLGVEVTEPRNVFYWNGEDDAREIMEHAFATCQHFGINPRDLVDRLYFASGFDEPMELAIGSGSHVKIDHDAFRLWRERIDDMGISVLMIDPFKACHRVPENDNDAIDVVASALLRLAHRKEIAIEIWHHLRKLASGHDISGADVRGASALLAKARSVRLLKGMQPAEAARAGLSDHRPFFRLETDKANYAGTGGAAWFQLVSVEVALANGDSATTVASWEFPDTFDGVEATHRERVRAMVEAGEYRADPRSDEWVGHPIADVLGLDAKRDKPRLKAIIKAWIADGTLRTIKRKDATRHVRVYVKAGAASVHNSELTQD